MKTKIYTVDAFAHAPFTGNPAAVCPLDSPRDEAWMQRVAMEMNLSETAFLWPEADGFRLRWFTPAVEVSLCGHATLASAHVLWETEQLPGISTVRFQTLSGLLTAEKQGEEIQLNFPAKPIEAVAAPAGLPEALGAAIRFVGRNSMDYLVELESETAVRQLEPDAGRLADLPVRGVIVTARSSEPRFDFVSRFFAPAAGVPEDPVTGSAHCALGPFWAERLGKTELLGYQASRRGGIVRVALVDQRVLLSGRAITIFRGELLAH
jgi:PhzF family phenazine biosynthesis protein